MIRRRHGMDIDEIRKSTIESMREAAKVSDEMIEVCGSCASFEWEVLSARGEWCQRKDEATTCDDYCGEWTLAEESNDLNQLPERRGE